MIKVSNHFDAGDPLPFVNLARVDTYFDYYSSTKLVCEVTVDDIRMTPDVPLGASMLVEVSINDSMFAATCEFVPSLGTGTWTYNALGGPVGTSDSYADGDTIRLEISTTVISTVLNVKMEFFLNGTSKGSATGPADTLLWDLCDMPFGWGLRGASHTGTREADFDDASIVLT